MNNSFTCLGGGLYRRNGHFYHRPQLPSGQRTYRALKPQPINAKAARIALHRLKFGDPSLEVGTTPGVTIGEILRDYAANGYPDRHRSRRVGKALSQEMSRVSTLARYWDRFKVANLTGTAAFDDYADWRAGQAKKGFPGHRAAELDLNTLRNAIRWAVRKGALLRRDPFAAQGLVIPRYRKEREIRHCRECAPRSGDELHSIAAHLFESRNGAAMGWLTLITAMTGLRVSEIVQLRTDAKEGEPGYIDQGLGVLYVRRAKKGAHNYFRIHPALKECLKAFFAWRTRYLRHTKRQRLPWWFPGKSGSNHVEEQSLSHALRRVGNLLYKEDRTAHGLRSFYVTVRRSMGVSDSEIALEIGQISGGREIVRTYGEATPKKVSWLPTDPQTSPAWVGLEASPAPAPQRSSGQASALVRGALSTRRRKSSTAPASASA